MTDRIIIIDKLSGAELGYVEKRKDATYVFIKTKIAQLINPCLYIYDIIIDIKELIKIIHATQPKYLSGITNLDPPKAAEAIRSCIAYILERKTEAIKAEKKYKVVKKEVKGEKRTSKESFDHFFK